MRTEPFFAKIIARSFAGWVWLAFFETSCVGLANASRRVVDVADRHFPVIQRQIRQVMLENRRPRRRRRRGLCLRLDETAGRDEFGKQRERGNGISTGDHHGPKL